MFASAYLGMLQPLSTPSQLGAMADIRWAGLHEQTATALRQRKVHEVTRWPWPVLPRLKVLELCYGCAIPVVCCSNLLHWCRSSCRLVVELWLKKLNSDGLTQINRCHSLTWLKLFDLAWAVLTSPPCLISVWLAARNRCFGCHCRPSSVLSYPWCSELFLTCSREGSGVLQQVWVITTGS